MSDMLTMIRTLGDQLRWAADLDLPRLDPAEEVLVGGMGGSGIAGDYGAALAWSSPGRVAVHKGYAPLPGWVGRARPTMVAISYSGNTEETLDQVAAAAELDLPIVAMTTGGRLGELAESEGWPTVTVPSGMQPRAAVGYLVGGLARVLAASGMIAGVEPDLEEAAGLVDAATVEGSERWAEATRVMEALRGRVPIVYGGGAISGVVAQRWKTQINENAKLPAWWSLLPELDHNELVGWETMPQVTRDLLGVVALTDHSDHPRVAARLRHSRRLTSFAVPWVAEVGSAGKSELARLMSLTVTGDLVSWMLAEANGVDPTPVETIEKLKRLLAED